MDGGGGSSVRWRGVMVSQLRAMTSNAINTTPSGTPIITPRNTAAPSM
jgi:hypothetical protein